MKPFVTKLFFQRAIRCAALRAITGRSRDRLHPERGRFARAEVNAILRQSWRLYARLAPGIPREPRFGNRMNMSLSCLTLACFRVLLERGVERSYAVELIGDTAWQVYETWGRLPRAAGLLRYRDPRDRMRLAVDLFLRFPFAPPGYVFERLHADDGASLDMLRCPVADYFRQHDTSDLCLGTWCNLDYALAEMWGGWLERSETLSAGCERCDFRFKAPPKSGNASSP